MTANRRPLLGFGVFLLRERTDVVDQIPTFFRLDPRAFRRHVVMTVLNDVEEFTVGAILERSRIGEVRDGELHVLGSVAFAVAILAVTHFAVERPPLLGAGQGFRRWLYRIRLLGGFHRNRGIRRRVLGSR